MVGRHLLADRFNCWISLNYCVFSQISTNLIFGDPVKVTPRHGGGPLDGWKSECGEEVCRSYRITGFRAQALQKRISAWASKNKHLILVSCKVKIKLENYTWLRLVVLEFKNGGGGGGGEMNKQQFDDSLWALPDAQFSTPPSFGSFQGSHFTGILKIDGRKSFWLRYSIRAERFPLRNWLNLDFNCWKKPVKKWTWKLFFLRLQRYVEKRSISELTEVDR